MKILMLIDSLVRGGRERRLLELLKALTNDPIIKCELVLFSRRVEYEEVYKMNIPIHFLDRRIKKDPKVFFKLFKLCKKVRPAIIHSWGSMPTIYAIPTAHLLGIKIINASIADAPRTIGWNHPDFFRAKLSYPFVHRVVGNSQAGLQAYQAPSRWSNCIYNGFDFDRVANLPSPTTTKRKYTIPEGKKVIGMVGGFFDRKDYTSFLQAACRTVTRRSDVVFIAIGGGPNLAASRAMVPEECRASVIFTDMVSDVEALVQTFDIGILCTNSKVHLEGISNSILEYMILEKPVIATSGGGTDELILDEVTGFLIKPFDVPTLVGRIDYLLKHEHTAYRMGKLGKERIQKLFSLAKMEEAYRKLYYELTEYHPEVIST